MKSFEAYSQGALLQIQVTTLFIIKLMFKGVYKRHNKYVYITHYNWMYGSVGNVKVEVTRWLLRKQCREYHEGQAQVKSQPESISHSTGKTLPPRWIELLRRTQAMENEVLPWDTTHLIQRPCYQWGNPCQDPAGSQTTRIPPEDLTTIKRGKVQW